MLFKWIFIRWNFTRISMTKPVKNTNNRNRLCSHRSVHDFQSIATSSTQSVQFARDDIFLNLSDIFYVFFFHRGYPRVLLPHKSYWKYLKFRRIITRIPRYLCMYSGIELIIIRYVRLNREKKTITIAF